MEKSSGCWCFNPFETYAYARQIWIISPRFGVNTKKCLKRPPGQWKTPIVPLPNLRFVQSYILPPPGGVLSKLVAPQIENIRFFAQMTWFQSAHLKPQRFSHPVFWWFQTFFIKSCSSLIQGIYIEEKKPKENKTNLCETHTSSNPSVSGALKLLVSVAETPLFSGEPFPLNLKAGKMFVVKKPGRLLGLRSSFPWKIGPKQIAHTVMAPWVRFRKKAWVAVLSATYQGDKTFKWYEVSKKNDSISESQMRRVWYIYLHEWQFLW